jgi:mRNA interferase HigB
MRVLGVDRLKKFGRKHAASKSALDTWYAEVKTAQWATTHDIRKRYASADFLAGNRVIFNIKGNHYRVIVKVRYVSSLVVIEWIGTHAEYDKKQF